MLDRTPPPMKKGQRASSHAPSKPSTGASARSNSQRQAAAAAGAKQRPSQRLSDAAPSGSGGDQQQQQQQQQEQQQQQPQEQPQEQEQEEGEVPLDPAVELPKVKAQLAEVEADKLILTETVEKLTKQLASVEQQLKRLQQAPAVADAALSGRVSALEAAVADCKQVADKASADAAAAQQALSTVGLDDPEAAEEMQQSLSKGAQAYTEQQQLRDEFRQLQQRVTGTESSCGTHTTAIAALRADATKLQQQAGLEGAQAEFVAWAPAEMHPDQLQQHLAGAAGLSSNVFKGIERRFVPGSANSRGRDSRDSEGGRGAAGGNEAAGPGTAARGDGNSGSSGAAGAGSSQPGSGRGRQQMALYVVRLASSRYLHAAVGGRCRLTLSRQQLPIWVDRALTEEERAQRRKLAPLAKQLRRDGTRIRWQGAKLEQLVVRACGRKQWQEVNPLPPVEDGRSGELAASGEAGGVQ